VTSPDLRIVSTGATPEDVAAVTAVLTAALDELAEHAKADASARVSAWQRSQRSVRTSRGWGTGAWRNFEG
jgi:hypothetical protein